MQTGLECIGNLSTLDVAEVVLLAAQSLAKLGGNFVLDISHMGLVGGIIRASGLSQEGTERAMQCLHQKNSHELRRLCQEENCDAQSLLALVQADGAPWIVIEQLWRILDDEQLRESLAQLQAICNVLEDFGFGANIRVDFSVGSDMKYYSGVVFKGYLEGIPASVLSGGQYDKLPRKMGRKARAIGFAVYLGLLENRSHREDAFDVDTLILHDGTADPLELMAVSREAAALGSVLVTRELPQGRNWKVLRKFEKGVWVR
jgi:ATP phosphoribosyltransferase regulatory subunit